MGKCCFCEVETCDSWHSYYCAKCHKLKRVIHLFSIDKVMGVLENVLIVNEDVQKEKIEEELKCELTTREYSLRKRKEKQKATPLPTLTE